MTSLKESPCGCSTALRAAGWIGVAWRHPACVGSQIALVTERRKAMRIINVVTATPEKGKFGEMLEHLRKAVPVCRRIWPHMGFHVLTPRTGSLGRVLYVEQFASLAAHEAWQESWAKYPEVIEVVRRQIELAANESVETFQLVASTADA